MHRFLGASDGAVPLAGLIPDKTGALFGTTGGGSGAACPYGCGTVFRLTPPAANKTGWTETILHNFSGQAGDGAHPTSELVPSASGTLFGTTVSGGNGCKNPGGSAACGAVFAITGSGFTP